MNTYHPTHAFSWKVAFIVSFGVGLLALSLSIFLQTHTSIVSAFRNDVPSFAANASGAGGLGISFETPAEPVRLIIPAIGVDANVQSVGLYWRGDGTMGIPTNFTDVAWYNKGPRPGAPGNAVIDGHLDGRNVKEAVFYHLADLKPNDLVKVLDSKGNTWEFRVVETKLYDYNVSTTDIFSGDISKARLNLITCGGDWLKTEKVYDKRVVVFTELVTTQ